MKKFDIVFVVGLDSIKVKGVKARTFKEAIEKATKRNKKKLKEGWGHQVMVKAYDEWDRLTLYYIELGTRGGIKSIK